jgi:hypothetical protein
MAVVLSASLISCCCAVLLLQASNLGQLFLKPAPVSCIGLHGSSSSSRANAAAGDGEAGWGGSEDGEGGWGGEGYEGDGDYGNGGADGYNAGEALSWQMLLALS